MGEMANGPLWIISNPFFVLMIYVGFRCTIVTSTPTLPSHQHAPLLLAVIDERSVRTDTVIRVVRTDIVR